MGKAAGKWPLLTILVCLLGTRNSMGDPRPNVLFIAVDDLNHWVGYLGRNPQTKTPNIDRLARRGMAFTNAHCAAPVCNPSRAAVLSGLRPSTTGCYDNGEPWRQYIPEGVSLAGTFRRSGYQTLAAGKIHHGQHYVSEWDAYFQSTVPAIGIGVTKNEGFREPLRHDLKDEDLADWHSVDFCIEQLKKPHEKPFFLACGLIKPHLPFAVPRKYFALFPLESIKLPPYRDNDLNDIPPIGIGFSQQNNDHQKLAAAGRLEQAVQGYLAAIAYTDMNVGRLIDALDSSASRDNTIIVLWGDHGWHLGEKGRWRKNTLWEEATRAPLVIVAPGTTRAGSVCHRTVELLSLYPTLCELAGIPLPPHLEVGSLLPLLKNPTAEWRGVAVTTCGYMNHALRTDRWRYIRYADGGEELYDHTVDPYEWTNLAALAAYAPVKQELAAYLPQTNAEPRPRPVRVGIGDFSEDID